MSKPTEANSAKANSANQPEPTAPANSPNQTAQNQPDDQVIDPRDLVYAGGYRGDPREIVENPAVAPDMVEAAPEDLRDDLMPKEKQEDE